MHDFLEFLEEPCLIATKAASSEAISNNTVPVKANLFCYQSQIKNQQLIHCYTEFELTREQLDFLNKIMQAIHASAAKLVPQVTVAPAYILQFACSVAEKCAIRTLDLPDLRLMQSDQALKKKAWLTLRAVFL